MTADDKGQARKRVVIAEDEALIRMDLAEMLEEEGYEVVGQAGNGEDAVKLAAEHRPDLVILDVKMPVLDGISAAERIGAEKIAPVLMLTAFSQRELVERARDAGAMAYLVKPFSKADLVPAIEMATTRYEELRALVVQTAERLHAGRITKGDRVAILLNDSPEFIASFVSVISLGAIAVPISMRSVERTNGWRTSLTRCSALSSCSARTPSTSRELRFP